MDLNDLNSKNAIRVLRQISRLYGHLVQSRETYGHLVQSRETYINRPVSRRAEAVLPADVERAVCLTTLQTGYHGRRRARRRIARQLPGLPLWVERAALDGVG